MSRLPHALALFLALTGTAYALDYSVQLGREYTDRLLTIDDTAAAHVKLAQWCDGVGLKEKAQTHWQEAVFRDPDHKEARKALGYVWRNMTWIKASDVPPAPPARADAMVSNEQGEGEHRNNAQDPGRNCSRHGGKEEPQAAWAEVRLDRPPHHQHHRAAVGTPAARNVSNHNVPYRKEDLSLIHI